MSADLQTDAPTGVLMSDEDRSQPGADAAAGRSPASPSSLPSRFVRRLRLETTDATDRARSRLIGAFDRWPCADRKYLVVGSESSGTTAVGSFLFEGTPGIRCFRESKRQSWVWDAYKRIYQGQATHPGLPSPAALRRHQGAGLRHDHRAVPGRGSRTPASSTWCATLATSSAPPSGPGAPGSRRSATDIPWVTEDWLRLPEARTRSNGCACAGRPTLQPATEGRGCRSSCATRTSPPTRWGSSATSRAN